MGKRKDPLDTEYYSKSKVYRTNDLFMSMKSNQHPLTHADLENTHVVQQHSGRNKFRLMIVLLCSRYSSLLYV
jgi:hypothetical protein